MVRQVRVRRGPGVWIVDAGVEFLGFASGSEAERWARARAQQLADQGEAVELSVFDLRDQLAGTILFHPRLAAA